MCLFCWLLFAKVPFAPLILILALKSSPFWWEIHHPLCTLFADFSNLMCLPPDYYLLSLQTRYSTLCIQTGHSLSLTCVCCRYPSSLSGPLVGTASPSIALGLLCSEASNFVTFMQYTMLSKKQSCAFSKPASPVPSAPSHLAGSNWFSMIFLGKYCCCSSTFHWLLSVSRQKLKGYISGPRISWPLKQGQTLNTWNASSTGRILPFFLALCPGWPFCDFAACSSSPCSSLGLAVLQPAAPGLLRS